MNTLKKYKAAKLFFVVLLCLIPSFFCMLHKTQLHVDEVLTYALSNSTTGPYLYVWRTGIGDDSVSTRYASKQTSLTDTEGAFFQKWHTGEEFKNYITVQEGEQFDFSSVYYNQSCDVHPPLYYYIIHTICSIFPNTFSKWFAFIPNAIFMVGCVCLLYFIATKIGLSENVAILIVLFWSFSRAGISDMVFLRMYMMLTFITLLSVYCHIKLYSNPCGKLLFPIFLINLIGFLTQYYYYIFCFFLTMVFCFYFLYHRRVKFAFVYGLTVLCAVGLAIALFPAAIKHIFKGAYTESYTLQGLSIGGIISWLNIVIKDFVGTFSYKFDIVFTAIWLILLFFLVIRFTLNLFAHKSYLNNSIHKFVNVITSRPSLYWLIMLVTILTGSILGMVSPIMPMYQDRYYFYIFPFFAIYFIDILRTLFLRLLNGVQKTKIKHSIICLALSVLIITSNVFPRNNYIDYSTNTTSLSDVLKEETCFLALQQDLRIHVYPIYLQYADKVFVSHEVTDSLCHEINNFHGKQAYILVQFTMTSTPGIKKLLDSINYQVTILDSDIETTLGYKLNDALLLVDYTKPKDGLLAICDCTDESNPNDPI